MIETPEIAVTAEQPAAVIHLTVPRSEIQNVMGPAVREIFAALAGQGIQAAGPWFTMHLRRPTDTFDLEVSVPVSGEVAAAGRVKPGRLPAATVARTVYHGDYPGLGSAWGELHSWIAAEGLSPAQHLWEVYLVGPESGLDPTSWRTQLNIPLTPAA